MTTRRDWSEIVDQIRKRNPEAEATLYVDFAPSIKLRLSRCLGSQDVDDKVHDAFIVILTAIRSGKLHQPAALPGFIKTIVVRQSSRLIEEAIHERAVIFRDGQQTGKLNPMSQFAVSARDADTPEKEVLEHEEGMVVMRAIKALPLLEREILTRFYLNEETPEKIRAELRLTANQFRLTKSKAVAKFARIGRAIGSNLPPAARRRTSKSADARGH